jgi:hypothetical protein
LGLKNREGKKIDSQGPSRANATRRFREEKERKRVEAVEKRGPAERKSEQAESSAGDGPTSSTEAVITPGPSNNLPK